MSGVAVSALDPKLASKYLAGRGDPHSEQDDSQRRGVGGRAPWEPRGLMLRGDGARQLVLWLTITGRYGIMERYAVWCAWSGGGGWLGTVRTAGPGRPRR